LENATFDWDAEDQEDGNIQHILSHGVQAEEVEEAILDSRRLGVPAYNVGDEQRYGLLGATEGGRILLVFYTWRDGKIRPITAREAGDGEKRRYRQRGK
jgi:uncharacterized DUF497 family protein